MKIYSVVILKKVPTKLIYIYIYICTYIVATWMKLWYGCGFSCEDWNKDDLRIPEPDESSFFKDASWNLLLLDFQTPTAAKESWWQPPSMTSKEEYYYMLISLIAPLNLKVFDSGARSSAGPQYTSSSEMALASNTCCEKQDFVQSKSDKGKLTIPEYSLYQNALSLPSSSKTQVFRQLLRAEDASDRASHWLLRILLSFWVFQRGDSPATHVGFYEVPSGLCSTTWDDCRFHLGVSPVQLPIILHPHVAKTK